MDRHSDLPDLSDLRLLNKKQVSAALGLSRVQIWRLEKAGKFPRRVQLSPNRVAWFRSDILAFLNSRPRASIPSRPPAREDKP